MNAAVVRAFAPPRDPASTRNLSTQLLRGLGGAIALAGLALSWNLGHLPQREPIACAAADSTAIAPDLALYLEVIARVRRGEAYYTVAAQSIPSHGFPTSSPLNWRLPTYAWALSCLPCAGWIQLTLISLSLAALAATFAARVKLDGPLCAGLTTLVMIGVLRWSVDGYACVAQEPWAATLLVLALAAHRAGEQNSVCRFVGIAAATGALFVRELALPFCGMGFLVALYHRRWREASAWSAGLALFFAFYAWHVGQVRAQLATSGVAAAPEMAQWLRFGGLDFVLLSLRMNGLLFQAPGAVLWLFLLAGLLGACQSSGETEQLAGLAATAYVVAFAFLGRPENFYWGLIPAPLLAWGIGSLPLSVSVLGAPSSTTAATSAQPG